MNLPFKAERFWIRLTLILYTVIIVVNTDKIYQYSTGKCLIIKYINVECRWEIIL